MLWLVLPLLMFAGMAISYFTSPEVESDGMTEEFIGDDKVWGT